MNFFLACTCLCMFISCNSDIGLSQPAEIVYENEARVEVDIIKEPDPIGALDILVVLDRSGSMYDDAQKIGEGISILASQISALTNDYLIQFMTTDIECATTALVGPFDINSLAIDLEMAPDLLSTNCAGEAGFGSSYLYLTNEISFVREDADLLIFFVTDEEEQSSITTSVYKEWLDTLKVAPQRLDVVSLVTTEDSLCTNSYGLIGYKYIELMSLYNKSAIDLCSDWTPWLNESSFLTAFKSSVELDFWPLQETLSVRTSDDIILERDIDWYWDEELNTVYLLIEPELSEVYIVAYETYE